MSPASRPPRRMSPSARREHLIAAALELFGNHPPELVTVEAITERADISRPLFYRYFANIHELHLAALRSVTDGLIDRLATAEEGTEPLERLRASLRGLVDVVDEYRAGYVALLRNGSVVATSATDAVVDQVRNRAVEVILDYTGFGDPSPLLLVTLRCWTAVVEGALVSWLQDGTPARDQLDGWLVDQLAAMVAATAVHDPVAAEFVAQSSAQPSTSSGVRGPGPT